MLGGAGGVVAGVEDVDALDWGLGAEGGGPAEGDGVAGDGVDFQDGEADGGLASLAGDEGGLGGEGGRAQGVAGQEVDRVRGVGEVGGQQGVGDVDVEGGQERGKAVDHVGGGAGGQAGWSAWATSGWWWWGGCWSGRSRGRAWSLRNGGSKAGQGGDDDGSGELHFRMFESVWGEVNY